MCCLYAVHFNQLYYGKRVKTEQNAERIMQMFWCIFDFYSLTDEVRVIEGKRIKKITWSETIIPSSYR